MEERVIISGITQFNFAFQSGIKTTAIVFTILMTEVFYGTNIYAQINGVEIGDRVRITAPIVDDRRIIGTVSSFSLTSLSLARKDTALLIPYPLIQELDLSVGKKRNLGKGTLIGSVSGGLLLGAIAYSSSSSCNEEEEWCLLSDAQAFKAGALIGVLIGGVFGAIIGTNTETDRWEEMPVRISAGTTSTFYKSQKINPTVSIQITF